MKKSRILSGITAFAFMLSVASCAEKGGETENSGSSSGNSAAPVSAQEAFANSYKIDGDGITPPVGYIQSMKFIGDDGKIFISGNDDTGASKMYITDKDFTDFKAIEFSPEADENADNYYTSFVCNDGNICVWSSVVTYGDFEKPDFDDPDFDSENFDWDGYYNAAEYSYMIYTIDTDGNIISEKEITGIDKYKDDETGNVYLNNVMMCGKQFCVVVSTGGDERCVKIEEDGSLGEEVDLGDDYVYNLYNYASDAEGNIYYSSYNSENATIKKMAADTFEISEYISVKGDDIRYINYLFEGSGEYKFFTSDRSQLYGIKEDGTAEEVINWIDSNLNGDYINYILPLENSEFIVYERDWNTGKSEIYRLVQCDASEISEVTIINMVMEYEDTETISKINEFNKKNDKYRIKVEEYSKYYEWDEDSGSYLNSPANQLKMDIAAGKQIDIIAMNTGSSSLSSLRKQGAFADLYEFMGTNGTVSKEELVPNIIAAGEYNGKLYNLTPYFGINTLAVKSKFYDGDTWTMADIIDTYDKVSDKMSLFRYDMRKIDALTTFMSTSNFVDFEKGECHFDSPEFISLLEFCNSIDENSFPDWDNMSNEEMNAYYRDQEVAIMNDKALIENAYTYSPREFMRVKYSTFNEDCKFVGYPSAPGSGAMLTANISYSIMANSKNKEVAWEFISQLFTYEHFEENANNMYMFPSNRAAFNKLLDESMENPYYIDGEGNKHEYEETAYINDEVIKLPNLSQEEREWLEDYVFNTTASMNDLWTTSIMPIIKEEAEAYFNGERDAKATAEILQNRLSILVSEQY